MEIPIELSHEGLRLERRNDEVKVFDPIRKIWVSFLPEEFVRQWILHHFIHQMQYPASLIAVEKKIPGHHKGRRFDLLVFGRDHKPWMLVECKSPEVPIRHQSLFQLLDYHGHLPARYWLLTNGMQTYCADAGDPQQIEWIDRLPAYHF